MGEVKEAARDQEWRDHWRRVAEERLSRKRVNDRETTDLRLRVALLDLIDELLGRSG